MSITTDQAHNYTIKFVHVENGDNAWKDIAEKVDISLDYIEITPINACDPSYAYANMNDEAGTMVKCSGSCSSEIYSEEEISNAITNTVKPFNIIKADFSCCKLTDKKKHCRWASFTAMTKILQVYEDLQLKSEYLPYIVINTTSMHNTDDKFIDEMIDEITAAYVATLHDYPVIFVAVDDNRPINRKSYRTTGHMQYLDFNNLNENSSKKNKDDKKKKKKKNKKDKKGDK